MAFLASSILPAAFTLGAIINTTLLIVSGFFAALSSISARMPVEGFSLIIFSPW